MTLGFGFLITLDSPPLDLRSSPVLVPIAQAMVALPLVVRTGAPVLVAVDHRQREAAAALGAGPARVRVSSWFPTTTSTMNPMSGRSNTAGTAAPGSILRPRTAL